MTNFNSYLKKGNLLLIVSLLSMSLIKPDQDYFRIGLSVSKKVGNAVVRNQIKRYIRQTFLELKEEIDTKKDYVIIARKPAADMDFFQVKSSLIHVLKRSKSLTFKLKKNNMVETEFFLFI